MNTRPDRQQHATRDQNTTPAIQTKRIVRQQPMGTSDLVQIFTLDLTHCPRFDRAAEYTLACQTRSAWLQLVFSLKTQHQRLAALLSEHHLPSSYDAISEVQILRLLHAVHVHVDRAQTHGTRHDLTALRSWLTGMRAALAHFHNCRDEMVRRNLRFVVMLARRHQHRGVHVLDLVQEGTLGLMRAVEKFDPDRGVRFASYAVWWIREAFARVLASREETASFADPPCGEDDEDSWIDRLAAPNETSPETMILNADTAKGLHHALTCLPVQEADIIRLRFGLGEGRPLTLAQVGQRLGLSRAQVQLREQRAVTRLRAYMQRLDTIPQNGAPDLRQRWRTAA